MLRRAVCVLSLAAALFALLPGAANATDAVIPTTERARIDGLPSAAAAAPQDGATVSEPVETPIPFGVVGFTLPADADVEFRTSPDGRRWQDWTSVERSGEGAKGPDAGTAEATGADGRWQRTSDPVWVGQSRWLQVRVRDGSPGDVVAHLIDTQGLSSSFLERTWDAVRSALRDSAAPAPASADAWRPQIISRAEWGANEALRKAPPKYTEPRAAVIHHTAEANNYAPHEAPAIIRAMYHYHTLVRGWSDIGYNLIVDRYGRVYEGRAGGADRGVLGAHARGFNHGTFGVSVMGDYNTANPTPASLEALARVIAWKFKVHGIDVFAPTRFVSGGSTLHPRGAIVDLPTIVGHRHVGVTECAGNSLDFLLPALRQRVVDLGPSFVDVSSAVDDAVEGLADRGIITGCAERRLCPDRLVTRAQLATMVARAIAPPPGPPDAFRDTAGSLHDAAIEALAGAGIVKGCAQGAFCPNLPVDRGQLATILVRAFDHLRPRAWSSFDDVSRSAHRTAINGLAVRGVTNGCGDERYCPDAPVTRAQAAILLARAMERPARR